MLYRGVISGDGFDGRNGRISMSILEVLKRDI